MRAMQARLRVGCITGGCATCGLVDLLDQSCQIAVRIRHPATWRSLPSRYLTRATSLHPLAHFVEVWREMLFDWEQFQFIDAQQDQDGGPSYPVGC